MSDLAVVESAEVQALRTLLREETARRQAAEAKLGKLPERVLEVVAAIKRLGVVRATGPIFGKAEMIARQDALTDVVMLADALVKEGTWSK